MEKSNNRVLNELLVNLFHNVMDAEAKAVITDEFRDITNNDMHILEAIGIEAVSYTHLRRYGSWQTRCSRICIGRISGKYRRKADIRTPWNS